MWSAAIVATYVAFLTCQALASRSNSGSTYGKVDTEASLPENNISTINSTTNDPLRFNITSLFPTKQANGLFSGIWKRGNSPRLYPKKYDWKSTMITQGPWTVEFPLGQAPPLQQPCSIEVTHQTTWGEGYRFGWFHYNRHRLMFKLPRKDIPEALVREAVTGLWFWGPYYWPDNDWPNRCESLSHNFKVWRGWALADGQWFIDFDDYTHIGGRQAARCQTEFFIMSFGQWTGCHYEHALKEYVRKEADKEGLGAPRTG